LPFIEVER